MSKRSRTLKVAAVVLLLLVAGMMGYAFYTNLKGEEVAPITTSIAVSPAHEPREVSDISTDDRGNLVISYSDGTTQNAGRVTGRDGIGQYPTQAQLAVALAQYCQSGTCDAKQPTQAQIVAALDVYCADGYCRGTDGEDGKNGKPITAQQIATAVANFCADGRCKGEDGERGTNGTNGKDGAPGVNGTKGVDGASSTLRCVTRPLNGSTARYIAWKYTTEADTAYRDLYKLPTWAEATNCKAL